jgi:hypothetical protein
MSVEDSSKVSLKSKADVEKLLAKEEATIIHREAGKSEIWKIFGNIEYDHSIVKGYVACKACRKVYSYQSADGTQTLRKHRCEKGESGPKAKSATPQQHKGYNWSLAGFSKSASKNIIPQSTKDELNRKVVIACALDYRPLSFACCEGFQLLAQSLIDIGAKYPDADAKTLFNNQSTYSRSVLPKLAQEVRDDLRTVLSKQFLTMPKSLCPVAFTGDHWTDKYRQIEYTSIAVFFVDTDFTLHAYDLCVQKYNENSKHAQNIRADILGKLEVYVDKEEMKREAKFVFVSDSDPKLVAALRQDFDRQSCVCHDLSLAVKTGLKSVESGAVGMTIESCKNLVRYFKKSGMNRRLSKTLKQEVETRFNSTYIMLQSLDCVFDEVTVMLAENDNMSYVAVIKRKTLQAICKQLKRFDDASRKLAVEKEETLHLVMPVLYELHAKLQKEEQRYRDAEDSDMIELCSELANGVAEKCLSKLTWYHCAAAILYPPFLNHDCLVSRDGEVVQVRRDLLAIASSFRNFSDQAVLPPPPQKKPRKVLQDSDDSESEAAVDLDMGESTMDEIDKYFSSSFDSDELSPLKFWKSQSKRFPILSTIARSVFAIPATQNKSERAFSAAGHTVTDLRTSLDPDHVDDLLLLRSHYRLKNVVTEKGDDKL